MHLRDGLQTRVTVVQRYDHLVERGEIDRAIRRRSGWRARSTG